MAFFEDKKEEKVEETPAAPTTIKVGEKEYTQEDQENFEKEYGGKNQE